MFDVCDVIVHFEQNEQASEEICIYNIYEVAQAIKLRPKFIYHSKHHPVGYWNDATPMDLSDSEGQEALDQSISHEDDRKRFSLYKGKFYEFKSDNFEGYHGYPVEKSTIPNNIQKELERS